MEVVFENDFIKMSKTGRDYDFMGVIENKTNDNIIVKVGDECESYDIEIQANDWVGLLNNEVDCELYKEILNNNFHIVKGE